MASYSVDAGTLDLTAPEMNALRSLVADGEPGAAAVASLRAARIVDAEDRIHRTLRAFADQLKLATDEWSIVSVEPHLNYCYRVLVTDHSIIGHGTSLSDVDSAQGETATPVLFTHRGRLGVVLSQVLAVPPRGRAIPTGTRGRTVTWESMLRAVNGDADQSPWPGDGVSRLWSLAATVAGFENPLFGVQTDSERLAIGQPVGDDEVLLVGSDPEAIFRRLCCAF